MIKKNSKLLDKLSTIIGTILCLILIPILIVNVTLIIKSYTNKDEIPSLFNTTPMVVLTDSMYPSIKSGDLILLENIDISLVKEGDIVTFFDPLNNSTNTVTHRVVEVIHDGEVKLKTKGDANNIVDNFFVTSDEFVGVYKSKISGLGNIAMFMATTKGLVICVIVPLILFVGFDIARRFKYDKKTKSEKKALLEELERLKKEV